MIFIDANIFLAGDNLNDVNHTRALKILKEIESGKFGDYFTSDYVFNEIIGVTFRKKGKNRAVLLGEQILKSILMINIDDHLLKETWKIFSNTKLNLNLVDCTHLAAMKIINVELIATFDKEFMNMLEIQVIS